MFAVTKPHLPGVDGPMRNALVPGTSPRYATDPENTGCETGAAQRLQCGMHAVRADHDITPDATAPLANVTRSRSAPSRPT